VIHNYEAKVIKERGHCQHGLKCSLEFHGVPNQDEISLQQCGECHQSLGDNNNILDITIFLLLAASFFLWNFS
jgi:hypothetical protein